MSTRNATTVGVGVIGYGYWGPNLVRNLASMEAEGIKLLAVADRDPERRTSVQSQYPAIGVFKDSAAVIDDPEVDAVVIATPVASHFELAAAALHAGKHVFVEKPITAGVRQAEKLNELADERGLVLMVGHVFEYNPAVRYIKDIVASGELGNVLYIRSIRVNLGIYQRDISALWDLAPHDISIIQHVLGTTPNAVSAVGHAHVTSGVPDIVNLNLDFGEARIATVVVSWLDPRKVREMTVIGTKKMLVYDDISPMEKIRLYDKGVDGPASHGTFDNYSYSYRYGDIRSPLIEGAEPLREECRDFVESIREGKRPLSDGRSGLRVIRSLAAAQLSLERSGEMVSLDDPGIPDVTGLIGGGSGHDFR